MNLTVQAPNSKTVLIPVASELIKGKFATDVETVNGLKVNHFYEQVKGEFFQSALFRLALGVEVKEEDIWKKYKKSDKIFLFVCGVNNN